MRCIFNMRFSLSSRSIILVLSISSFVILMYYWFLSEIIINENKASQIEKTHHFMKESSTHQLASRKGEVEGDSVASNLNVFSNFGRHYNKMGLMAIKMNKDTFSTGLACASELFITECNNAGLAAYLLMTLDHISACRILGATPTVFWRNCGPACPNATVNAWEWFFEPLNRKIEEKAKKVLCFGSYLGPETLLWKLGSRKRKNTYDSPYDLLDLSFRPRFVAGYYPTRLITRNVRQWANNLIKQHVNVKSEIQEAVDIFYDQHFFGYTVLAVHVRGTDHGSETDDGKLPSLNSWIQNAKSILKSLPTPNKIFIASDNSESIIKFVNEFGKKVVYIKAYRAVKYHGKEVHGSSYDPYKLGSEVLIDILLMAKCDHFLHAESSVAALVNYFNPEIPTHFLGSEVKNRGDVAKSSLFGHIGDVNINMEEVKNKPYGKPSEEDLKMDSLDAFYCYKQNSQHSVCPNFRKGISLDFSKLREYIITPKVKI